MIVMEAANEETTEERNEQNTLNLDSQSIIMEADAQRDPNLSQQMQFLEASSILNQKDLQNQQMQQFASNAPSNGSSNVNTDILTYSLTNTFSTIESLHDELAAIRMEISQKKGTQLIKNIQRYAKEIEEDKLEDSIHCENVDNSLEKIEKEEAQFIHEIKGFYQRIH